MRLIGSIAIHAVLAALLLALRGPHATPPITPALATIELVDIEPPTPPELPAPIPLPSDPDPGGSGGRAITKDTTHVPRHPVAPPSPDGGEDVAAIVGAVSIDHDGAGAGRGTGLGWGDGDGYGGYADVHDIALPPAPPPPPPPPTQQPPASKAAAPHLVFPVRQVERDESELFVARLTIDDEGFVVGAKLARGFGGKRDEDAMAAVWRFRYAPARDDAGRPIRTTIEQHFDVGR